MNSTSEKHSFRFRLNAFRKQRVVLDERDPVELRRHRAERYAKKNKTCGKKAVFS